MKFLLFFSAAVVAYLVSGINPAIVISKAVYGKDIRTCGSGNAGFTNFKRTFGNKWAWWVMLIDLSKAAVVVAIFARLFGKYMGDYQFGAAYTGFFALMGHAYPCWYGFKGGKGFLVNMSVIWFIDWRAGLIALTVMLVLLFTTKYMSVATVVALLTCPVTLIVVKAPPAAVILYTICVVFMTWKHRGNFKRLRQGTESKFALKRSK